jgi:hypothetical protein
MGYVKESHGYWISSGDTRFEPVFLSPSARITRVELSGGYGSRDFSLKCGGRRLYGSTDLGLFFRELYFLLVQLERGSLNF